MAYVLLVEDDPIALKLHYLMLKKMNCEVDCAINGNQALTMCLNNYDLLLMDCGLPGIDGLEVSKKIRQLEQENQIIPRTIIMLSAYTLDEDLKNQCELADINKFVTKPIRYETLEQLLLDYS